MLFEKYFSIILVKLQWFPEESGVNNADLILVGYNFLDNYKNQNGIIFFIY